MTTRPCLYFLMICALLSLGCEEDEAPSPAEPSAGVSAPQEPEAGAQPTPEAGVSAPPQPETTPTPSGGEPVDPSAGASAGGDPATTGGQSGGAEGGRSEPPADREVTLDSIERAFRENLMALEGMWAAECAACNGLTGEALTMCAAADYDYALYVAGCLHESPLSDEELRAFMSGLACQGQLIAGHASCQESEGLSCETYAMECALPFEQDLTCQEGLSDELLAVSAACYEEATCADEPCLMCEGGGQQYPESWRCDGFADCEDGSDEPDDCPTFMCADMSDTISLQWQCDGVEDCVDGSDELNCEG